MWAGAMALLLGESGAALLGFLRPTISDRGFGGRVRAGRVEEFPIGSVSHVRAGRFYISHLPEGLLVMWHRCTHLGCTVPWVEAEGQFHCPCHSSLFDTRGEVITGPAPRPLDLFPLEVVEGEVWVDTGQVIRRQRFDESQTTKA